MTELPTLATEAAVSAPGPAFEGVPLPFARRQPGTGEPRWACRRARIEPDALADLEAVVRATGRLLSRYAGAGARAHLVLLADDRPPRWLRVDTAGDRAGDHAVAAVPLVQVAIAVRGTGDRPAFRPPGVGLQFECAGDTLRVWYDTAVLDSDGVDRVVEDFVATLADPADTCPPLASVTIGRDRTFTDGRSILHIIERHARTSPDAVAAISTGDRATYAELDQRAERLAARLRARGAAPETYVVLLLPPSVDLMVGALAAFKAGAAFVPVDPEYPVPRIRELLSSVPDPVIVTTTAFLHAVGSGQDQILLDAPGDEADAGWPATTTRRTPVSPDSLACALFTSASTGSSKAVMITHRGLLNLAHCARERLALTPADRFLQLASPSFSAFLEEAFPSLVAGGSLILAGYRVGMPSVPQLLENLRRYEATAFGITTAHWHHLVEDLAASGDRLPPKVRLALMGSERALPDRVRAWCRLGVPMVHVYGPTEATATASYFHLGEESTGPERGYLLPIGRVIANTRMYLCDRELRLVPYGVPGEVYVGGVSLARGYLGAPAATADRFVPDPFGPSGQRLYRTGDLARFLPDGNLEFLTREASLIKVHGCRINPSEVEAVLERHPAVARSAVVATPGPHGDDRLTAYLVARGDVAADAREIRRFLSAQLPSFMVPAVLTMVETLPLNANGKIDRRALATTRAATGGAAGPEPGTPTERAVAQVWEAVLGVPSVAATDDFFELGGDSLQMVRVATELRRRLGVDLDLAELFATPTLARVGELVDRKRSADPHGEVLDAAALRARRELVSRTLATRTGIQRAAPISMSQQGLWFVTQVQPGSPLYTTAWRCDLHGRLDVDALRVAVRVAMFRHEPLRTRFVTEGGQPLQIVTDPPDDPLRVVALSGADSAARDREAEAICADVATRPFDLATAPLCRVVLLPVEPERHTLLVVVHHLVCDHWSEGVILRDLAAAYGAAVAGRAPDLPALPLTYQDFAVWQRAGLARGTAQPLLHYWRGQLSGLAETPLPYDFPRRPDHDFAGESISAAIPDELRAATRTLAGALSATPYMVLLAAFFTLLHLRIGGTDLCVGSPYANRGRPEFEPLVGYFVNMVGLRLDVSGDPTFGGLVERTRQVCIDAYNHQELPFHLAARVANGHERRPGANPLFQAAFTMDDDPATGVTAPGLRFGPVTDVPTGRVGLDLVMLVVTRPDELVATLDYSTRLFRRQTVRSMLDEYVSILRRGTADPQVRISALAAGEELPLIDALCQLWANAFGVASVAADQDFFEMGGTSLLAAQIVADISDLIGTELSLRTFFEAANIADLAGRIGRQYGVDTVSAHGLADLRQEAIGDIIGGIDDMSDEDVRAALDDRWPAATPESP